VSFMSDAKTFEVGRRAEQLRAKLERLRWSRQLATERGCVYLGPADFVLQEGRFYTPTHTPEEVGARRACFGNAMTLAALFGYRSVEGYAPDPGNRPRRRSTTPGTSRSDGRVVDATWANTGRAYLGVEFSLGRADDCDLERRRERPRSSTGDGRCSGSRGPAMDYDRKREPSEMLAPVLARDVERLREVMRTFRR
jgi:hypothetical protein